MMKQRNLVLY